MTISDKLSFGIEDHTVPVLLVRSNQLAGSLYPAEGALENVCTTSWNANEVAGFASPKGTSRPSHSVGGLSFLLYLAFLRPARKATYQTSTLPGIKLPE